MEHRPLSHYSPALQRYLDEPASLYERLIAASGSDRKKFYVDCHKPQLRTVREYVSRREPSQVERFPFVCVFHYEGCRQRFENKRDWKDHVVSQHLALSRVFWECTEPSCTRSECPRHQRLFANKHDFRTHLIQHHQPTNPHDTKHDVTFLPDAEVQWLLDRQDSSMRMLCGLPENLGCPMPQCASVRFTGPTAWDQRLNHAAEHFLSSPRCMDVFGGEKDAELIQWASRNSAAVYQEIPNVCLGQQECDKSLADSGYSSMPGMPRRPNVSQHGDSSPAMSSKMPGRTSDATSYHLSMEELCLSAEPISGIGGWVQGQEYLEPIIDEESSSSAYQSSQEIFSQHDSIEDHDTLDTSQGSVSSDASSRAPDENPETATVMQWFHGWLRQWLTPLTQQRPGGNGSQNTSSQSQTSSGSSTQKKKKGGEGAAQPRRDQKRKRGNGGEDDGNEESSKSQRVDQGSDIRMFACPFYKRNPRKYGQPKWKSCAHPGFPNIHRVKEHVYRRHSLPEYQCRRCRVDLETSEALEAHSLQLRACTPYIGAQDGLNQDQLKRMKSKKGAGKSKSKEDRWNDVYSIVFPYDQQKPSPYLGDTYQDKNAREFNLCHEFGRFLERELPPLVGRRLSTAGRPLPETIKDDIEQYVKELVPQLQGSFLEEMGFVSGGQLDVASTTNDGDSFVESTTTRRTSEDSATTLQQDGTSEYPTTLPKGNTSQESMSMFPTSDASKELTTMPPVGYDAADSTMFPDGDFSAQAGMMFPTSQMMPPYCPPTNQDWQAIYSQLGYDPNLPLGFGTT
ncbi:hypothetical protein FAGAP_3398 [Fusarium agapanthi]|uniref:C2H2-type domain-containing protein n=1 Tax=Fusarium agapanthi TaxID=1803897 RepID=A0A9P5BFB7_9HYPO|nr:hypothetical protein FAGAP_3398 [Fusarium agapanthi]